MTDTSDTGPTMFDIERRIVELETIADWKESLLIQARRLEVLQECGLLHEAMIEAYESRVRLFNDAAAALTPKVRKNGVSVDE